MPAADISLMAHLMRRAGFGATRAELEKLAEHGYENTVNDLVNPERFPDIEEDLLKRYYLELTYNDSLPQWTGEWVFRMINTQQPLREKMALFWHHVFATAWYKSEHTPSIVQQIHTFREYGMTNLSTILVELAKDPAMNYWLDNCENHKTEPNENWGRELLELFSMGVGHYSEDDIKNASRAFTGWTFQQPIPLYPYGNYPARFKYVEEDHDFSEKTFLGNTGNFNGEDIIDIVVKQEATARFICRHLYNFFVADEPQVPSWELEPPQAPAAIDEMVNAYFEHDGDVRSILRTMFNSEFFKDARFKKVKSPAELVTGTVKLAGTFRDAEEGLPRLGSVMTIMGQQLMNPPTVEGWHTGKEWIDGGTLNERINFAVNELNDVSKPGIQELISRFKAEAPVAPKRFVEMALDLVGPVIAGEETYDALMRFANLDGELTFDTDENAQKSAERIGRMVQLIVATREYQFA
jgi:uncharacterized protein (DUF1800 family)